MVSVAIGPFKVKCIVGLRRKRIRMSVFVKNQLLTRNLALKAYILYDIKCRRCLYRRCITFHSAIHLAVMMSLEGLECIMSSFSLTLTN